MNKILSSLLLLPLCMNMQAQEENIQLKDSMMQLREIVIKGNLPHTRLKGNSMITRIEGTALSSSGSAGEMLVKVPGMTGSEDNPQVLGKGTPLIYVNGRLLRDVTELKRLRSEDIRDVEVIQNPGALYDATVKSVVRIRTKKAQGEGFGLNLTAKDEQDLRYGFNTPNTKLGLNYRKNNVDVFGSVWYWHQDYRQYSWLEETTMAAKTFSQVGPYTMTWKNDNLVYTAGANWQLAENHSIGVRADLTQRPNKGKNMVIYDEDVREDGIFLDHLYSEQTSREEKPLAWLTNAYYNGQVGKLGIDFNFDFMNTEINTNRENRETSLVENDFVRSTSGAKSHLYATKLILSHPVWKGEMQVGTEMTFAKRHNTYWIDKLTIAPSDAYIRENCMAAFAEYGCDFGNAGKASVGLRYEHTLLDYEDRLGDNDLHRPQDELFPSASYSVSLGKVQTALSYSMKTARPSFFAMNDALTYISRYSMQAGNSQLKNEILQEVVWNTSYKWLTLTASYERTRDAISQWAFLMDGDAVLIKHINLERPIQTYGIYLGATPRVGVWSLNATAGVQKQNFYLDLTDAFGNVRRDTYNKPVYILNAFNTFSFKHNWQFEVNAQFSSKGHMQNFYNDYNSCRLDAVVQKSFLADKALTLRAEVSDILQRTHFDEFSDMGFYKILQNNRYSKHKLSLTVLYRFNAARSKYKGTGAGKEAQARMKY